MFASGLSQVNTLPRLENGTYARHKGLKSKPQDDLAGRSAASKAVTSIYFELRKHSAHSCSYFCSGLPAE